MKAIQMTSTVFSLPTHLDEHAHKAKADAHASNHRQVTHVGELPAAPRTVEETGLPLLLVSELALKVMHQHGLTHLHELSAHLRLSAALLDTLFAHLRKETLIDIRRRGALDGDVEYQLTQAGRTRAAEALARNLYSGPAPVSLAAYAAQVEAQSVGTMGVTQQQLEQVLADVVVRPEVRDQLGAAMNSQRAIMLYGPPGAGKTFLCEQMARLLTGHVTVPHAIEIDGEIIRVYDPLVHKAVPATDDLHATIDSRHRSDARWVLCERPIVITGGELTLEMLDLVYDPRAGYYQAPPHFKANGGIFLVDDLGRQMVTPRQLLNRWILPMEQRVDYLMLRNGNKFRIPFDAMLFFSTNMQPSDVADEAFLRRIGYKIFVGEMTLADYRRILRDVCDEHDVPFTDEAFETLHALHVEHGRLLFACYPRDLVGQVADYATYHGRKPELTPDMLAHVEKTS
jgi:predicted ATPase with chaperone activity